MSKKATDSEERFEEYNQGSYYSAKEGSTKDISKDDCIWEYSRTMGWIDVTDIFFGPPSTEDREGMIQNPMTGEWSFL